MRKITIEIPEPRDSSQLFDVVDEQGRRCDGLTFGEMLEQLVLFCAAAPPIKDKAGRAHYKMATPEEWERWRRSLEEK